jgi:hypothetical protein
MRIIKIIKKILMNWHKDNNYIQNIILTIKNNNNFHFFLKKLNIKKNFYIK